jgi:amino acid permease
MNKRSLVIIGYVVAVAFLAISIIYFITPANHLPSLFPGHDLASTKTHAKHGFAAILLALGAVAFAWFQGGPNSSKKDQRGTNSDN